MDRFFFSSVVWLLLASVLILLPGNTAAQSTTTTTTTLTSCGTDTVLQNNQCVCAATPSSGGMGGTLFLGGLLDLTSYPWATNIFEFTAQQINTTPASSQLFAAVDVAKFPQGVTHVLRDSQCSESVAVQEYWKLRQEYGTPHGVIGARCSGASSSLARISGLEAVPHISPASNSAKLTTSEFPYFSRLVAPNDERGEVGALITLVRQFGWDRVTILATDTQFSKDLVEEFRKNWVGEQFDRDGNSWTGSVAYSDTIRTRDDGLVDDDSVTQVLEGVPTDDPRQNSRIILLVAHNQHAYDILEEAHLSGFQEDTIWVGPSAWVGREGRPGKTYNLPKNPGYMGVAPYRNRDEQYQTFLEAYNQWVETPVEDLPPFAAETVDAIVAMTRAISDTYPNTDGAAIVRALRSQDFAGVSGRVQFTPEGDRLNPKYSLLNAQSLKGDGGADWTDVGTVDVVGDSVVLSSSLCFAEVGCDPLETPSDSYPIPPTKLPIWAIVLIVVLLMAFAFMTYKYYSSHMKKRNIKVELDAFRKSVVGMRAAERDHVPRISQGDGVEQALLPGSVAVVGNISVGAIWCWKETKSQMDRHDSNAIVGDPAECWIKYDDKSNAIIEKAHQDGIDFDCSPMPGYVISFPKMEQKKVSTGFTRAVNRVAVQQSASIAAGVVQSERLMPKDLHGEPQMVLLEGDVVQISTQRDDGWAFGTKYVVNLIYGWFLLASISSPIVFPYFRLHHADETAARDLIAVLVNRKGSMDDSSADETNIFCDTGWFPLDCTRVPSADDLEVLQKNIASGDLDPPAHWDTIKDATVARKVPISEGDPEFDRVVKAFYSTLKPPGFKLEAKVLKVERIQNFAMWQSYIVKRQTICYRETGHTVADGDDDVQRQALRRFERSWLWHGSNAEVVDKILQQGFNRSFCGKNATLYGKGVYFARDAAYSAYPRYAVPDKKGHQYMMACRVVVGEYCHGTKDAMTPDIRDAKSHSLYDSTVGVLKNDSMANPSIFVTYHGKLNKYVGI